MVCCPLKWCSYGPGWPHRLGVAFLAGGSIAALLADLHGIAPMHRVFSVASVPSMALLAVLAALPRVHPPCGVPKLSLRALTWADASMSFGGAG